MVARSHLCELSSSATDSSLTASFSKNVMSCPQPSSQLHGDPCSFASHACRRPLMTACWNVFLAPKRSGRARMNVAGFARVGFCRVLISPSSVGPPHLSVLEVIDAVCKEVCVCKTLDCIWRNLPVPSKALCGPDCYVMGANSVHSPRLAALSARPSARS